MSPTPSVINLYLYAAPLRVQSETDGYRHQHSPAVKEVVVGIGASVLLMALGGILAWGVNVDNAEGFNVNTIGIILMVVGAIGLAVSLAVFGSRRGGAVVRDRELL